MSASMEGKVETSARYLQLSEKYLFSNSGIPSVSATKDNYSISSIIRSHQLTTNPSSLPAFFPFRQIGKLPLETETTTVHLLLVELVLVLVRALLSALIPTGEKVVTVEGKFSRNLSCSLNLILTDPVPHISPSGVRLVVTTTTPETTSTSLVSHPVLRSVTLRKFSANSVE